MESFHLPWTNEALQDLLREIVTLGETTKVDFKRQFDLQNAEQQTELMKDIAALANTYDYSYKNHGFLVLGVNAGKLIHCEFRQDADALQATIDELVKTSIWPFIRTQFRIFTDGCASWGVIVVPPSSTAPHAFIKDGHKRYRGDVYVRRGTTTDKALWDDYVRFYRVHLQEETYSLRHQLQDLNREVSELRLAIETGAALHQATQKLTTPKHEQADEHVVRPPSRRKKRNLSLLALIQETLEAGVDPIEVGLVKEVDTLNAFLDSNALPWGLQITSKSDGEEALALIEKTAEPLWAALAALVERDSTAKYEDSLIEALGQLARQREAPTGMRFTDLGRYVRYYPLVVSLYLVFAVGAFKKRDSLLRKVAALPLTPRSFYDEPLPVSYALFMIRRADNVFQTRRPNYPEGGKWCDAVASVIKGLFDRGVNVSSRAWDPVANFFVGEFLLSLLPIQTKEAGHPSFGLYLFASESNPILRRFLSKDAKWAERVFETPFREVLATFDRLAPEVASSSGCWTRGGFQADAVATAYPGT